MYMVSMMGKNHALLLPWNIQKPYSSKESWGAKSQGLYTSSMFPPECWLSWGLLTFYSFFAIVWDWPFSANHYGGLLWYLLLSSLRESTRETCKAAAGYKPNCIRIIHFSGREDSFGFWDDVKLKHMHKYVYTAFHLQIAASECCWRSPEPKSPRQTQIPYDTREAVLSDRTQTFVNQGPKLMQMAGRNAKSNTLSAISA